MIRSLIVAMSLLLLPLSAAAQPFLPGTPSAGIDYELLPDPHIPYGKGGKIEVAEVFSYGCIHCFHFQPLVNAWKKNMGADIRWEYVPAAFGGPFDNFARAFYAAQILGVQKKTHDAVFNAIFVEHMVQSGSLEEIADIYAKLGVNRAKILETMQSEKVTKMMAAGKDFALRTGVTGTPTIIVNGKYRVIAIKATGLEGVFKTVDFLLARERQLAASAAAKPKG